MQITHFTARKRIGFKLPYEGFRALCLMETRRSRILPEITTLQTNLLRLDHVVSSKLGLSQSNVVYVDFETDDDGKAPTIEEAGRVISTHAQVAIALERFLPGALSNDRAEFPEFRIDGIQSFGNRATPKGRIVHFDDDFLVIANARPGGGSIHFLRNGQPAWTEINNFEEMVGKFWPALTDNALNEAYHPILATTADASVTDWVMTQAYVPALEFRGGFNISAHPLKPMIAPRHVIYADPEVVVTRSGEQGVIHFSEKDGRYVPVVLDEQRLRAFDELLHIAGLDYLDDKNPARLWINAAIDEQRIRMVRRYLPNIVDTRLFG